MIFLTLGTHQPFDRLVSVVDRWCGTRSGTSVFGQIPDPGQTGFRPRNFQWVEHLSPEAYRQRFIEAPFVVAHAGMGSILTAQSLCRPIVIFPRRAALREQRNDHQLATVRRFEGKPGVFSALDAEALTETMDRLLATPSVAVGPAISPFADERLTSALRSVIVEAEPASVLQRGEANPHPRDRKVASWS